MYKGAYLYWHTNHKRQRCWSTRRPQHRYIVETPQPPPTPAPIMYIPPEQVPHLTPGDTLDKWNMNEEIKEARAEPEFGPIYSTFASRQEPDVWPTLDYQAHPWLAAAIAALIMAFIAAVTVYFYNDARRRK